MIRGMGLYFSGRLAGDDEYQRVAGEIPGDAAHLRQQLVDLYQTARKEPDRFVWIGLFEPSRAELSLVQGVFDLPELQVEDAANHRQRPKVELGDRSALVIMKILSYYEQTSDVETGQISIFLGENFVITVRYGPLGDITSIRRRLESTPELLGNGPTAVAHAIMDATVDGYISVAEEVNRDIEQLEESVFSTARTDDAEMIYRIKRENLEMRRAVTPLIAISHALVRNNVPGIPEALQPFFQDLGDHVLRVADQAETNDQLLMTLLMASTSRQDLQQNTDMRRISAYVAIAAVPTMIAGIYGMNFDFMPELHWRFGYLVVLVLMGGVCLSLYRAFKNSGWL
ncbi:MAG: magnesium/cobalt transporter CorA [Candidatus Nanopelagicales bacterium]